MNENSRQPGRRALWTVGLGAATVAAYLALLGWDQQKDVDPVTGTETGPYQAWQVIALVAATGALAFVAGREHQVVPAVVAIPVALTATFAVTAATSSDQGLWPIGAALVAVGSAAGTAIVAWAGRRTATRRTVRASRNPPP